MKLIYTILFSGLFIISCKKEYEFKKDDSQVMEYGLRIDEYVFFYDEQVGFGMLRNVGFRLYDSINPQNNMRFPIQDTLIPKLKFTKIRSNKIITEGSGYPDNPPSYYNYMRLHGDNNIK